MLKPEKIFANKRAHFLPRKIIACLLGLCLFAGIFSVFNVFSTAQEAESGLSSSVSDEILTAINNVYIWKMNDKDASDLQNLIDTAFCEDPISGTNQNYITSIIQNPHVDADLSKYITALSNALDNAVSSEEGLFPTSLQKSLATLRICINYEREKTGWPETAKYLYLSDYVNQNVIDTALNNTIGEKGIMSYIWGLYMVEAWDMDNASMSKEDIINTLISLQCSDGGYTLSGDEGDVDVTAMAVQVLAPTYNWNMISSSYLPEEIAPLNKAMSASIEFLETRQLEDGDYESFGTRCSESTAQAILAFSSIDHISFRLLTDDTFIKNGKTILDGLMLYANKDGGFCHAAEGVSNDMATSQSLQALTALLNITSSAGKAGPQNVIPAGDIKNTANESSGSSKTLPLKIIIPTAIFIVAAAVGGFLSYKRKKPIHIISALVVALLASGIFLALDIRSKEGFENEKSKVILTESDKNVSEISFSIRAYTISEDDIFPETTLYVAKDSTVFEILREVCRTENIQLDYENNSVYGLAYIKGINSIYEYDHGDLSGWMYRVNGELPGIGLGYYKVNEGDVVEILYSKNIGRDLDD